jgi:hypothetical protein
MVSSHFFIFLFRALSGRNLLFYPPKGKNPTRKQPFFRAKPALLLVFLITTGITSCKTCDCPAYSEAGKTKTNAGIEIRPGSTAMYTKQATTDLQKPDWYDSGDWIIPR